MSEEHECNHEPGVDCPVHPITEDNQKVVEENDFDEVFLEELAEYEKENVDAVAGNEEVAQQIHNKDDVDSFGQQAVDPEPGLRVSDEPLGIKEPQKRLNIKPPGGLKWKR